MNSFKNQNSLFIPTILDVEASGFGVSSYPIEVGAINQVGKRFCSLIKPHEGWTHWDPEAESLHGISRAVLQQKGVNAHGVCKLLNKFLVGQVVYSDGWVVDDTWMIKLFEAAALPMQFRLSSLEMILNEQQMSIWHVVKESLFQKGKGQRHRASSDAALIQQTFVATQKICTQQNNNKLDS